MILVGLDEVGRGCWAGPLVAAAVVLDPHSPIGGLNDSKKLTKLHRERLALLVHAQALSVGIGWVWPEYIDVEGLTAAVKSAMEQAMSQIAVEYTNIVIDGNYNFLPGFERVRTEVRADGSVSEVSAASIVAKVARDRYMSEVAAVEYPEYGFENTSATVRPATSKC